MHRLPSSPARAQAAAEFEPILLEHFRTASAHLPAEIRDVMHYALFSVADRFCASVAWVFAPRLGMSMQKLAGPVSAIETLRICIDSKLRTPDHSQGMNDKYVEPALAEAAIYGLVPLAFQMVLCDSALTDSEKTQVLAILAGTGSPVHAIAASRRENHLATMTQHLSKTSLDHIRSIHDEKVGSMYRAMGEVFETLAPTRSKKGALSDWFGKIGLFAHWISVLTGDRTTDPRRTNHEVNPFVTPAEAMDTVLSLETEILERSKDFNLQIPTHDLIDPLAGALKARLQ